MVRFIEFMPLDAGETWQRSQVVPGEEILERIHAVWPLEPASVRGLDAAPADRYRFVDGGGEIGVITSVTRAFCGSCNRLRLTADGAIRNCLFANDELSARDLIRAGGSDDDIELAAACGGLGQAGRARHQRPRLPPPGAVDVHDRRLAPWRSRSPAACPKRPLGRSWKSGEHCWRRPSLLQSECRRASCRSASEKTWASSKPSCASLSAKKACCPFFDFSILIDAGAVALRVSVPPGAAAILDDFARLSA